MTLAAGSPYFGGAEDFLLVNAFAKRTPWLHVILTLYAGAVVLFIGLIAVGWWMARSRADVSSQAAVAWTALGTLVAVGVNQPLVSLFHEARPYTAIPNVLVLVNRTTDYSFPSDHATMAAAVATGLLFVNRRLGIAAWAAGVLLAFARVYVGAHYPFDVVAGLVLGAAVILLGRFAATRLLKSVLNRLAETKLRPALLSTRSSGADDVPARLVAKL